MPRFANRIRSIVSVIVRGSTFRSEGHFVRRFSIGSLDNGSITVPTTKDKEIVTVQHCHLTISLRPKTTMIRQYDASIWDSQCSIHRRNSLTTDFLFRPNRNYCAESIPSHQPGSVRANGPTRVGCCRKSKSPLTSFDFGCNSSLARRSNEISRFGPISVYSFLSSEAAV
jgi:hypothetical protein